MLEEGVFTCYISLALSFPVLVAVPFQYATFPSIMTPETKSIFAAPPSTGSKLVF